MREVCRRPAGNAMRAPSPPKGPPPEINRTRYTSDAGQHLWRAGWSGSVVVRGAWPLFQTPSLRPASTRAISLPHGRRRSGVRHHATGTIFERRIIASRVSSGTSWTTLVAAMSSSAGSPRKSNRVDILATAKSMGHIRMLSSVRATTRSCRSTSTRPSCTSFASSSSFWPFFPFPTHKHRVSRTTGRFRDSIGSVTRFNAWS